MTQIKHVRQHYTIASAHCAQRVTLPSAELELVIRVSPRPRIFGGKPSASVRGSQEFLRICVRRWTRPPSAHLWRRTGMHCITANGKMLKQSRDHNHAPLVSDISHVILLLELIWRCLYVYKFDDFMLSGSSDMIGAPTYFNGSHDLTTPPSGTVCRL